jgi:hypothetical protein
MTPEATYSVEQMRRSLKLAEKADLETKRVRKEIIEKTEHEFRTKSGRPPIGRSMREIADFRVASNPNFKAAVLANQWYIQQSIMYGVNALVEVMLDDAEGQSS